MYISVMLRVFYVSYDLSSLPLGEKYLYGPRVSLGRFSTRSVNYGPLNPYFIGSCGPDTEHDFSLVNKCNFPHFPYLGE